MIIKMRYYPTTEDDFKDSEKLNAAPWMLDLLKKNPSYLSWGNFEDYMSKKGDNWDARVDSESVDEGLWALDEYNELVNYYFEVTRDSKNCECCDGSGLNRATKKISDDWYSFDRERWISTSTNRRYNDLAWQYHITEVEIEALVKGGRLHDLMDRWYRYDKETNSWSYLENSERIQCDEPVYPTPEAVNEWNKKGMGHDSINQWIAVRARAEHLGVYGQCEECNGDGRIYTENKAKVSLQLWMLHPRKGCSRGVFIKNVLEHEVTKVIEHLKEARNRNNERFSKL
jgi:hypothetical protein